MGIADIAFLGLVREGPGEGGVIDRESAALRQQLPQLPVLRRELLAAPEAWKRVEVSASPSYCASCAPARQLGSVLNLVSGSE